MSNLRFSKILFTAVISSAALLNAKSVQADTPMTTGVIVEKMEIKQRHTYYFGIAQGLAYARFRKDTALNDNQKDFEGMRCIRNWFNEDSAQRTLEIDSAFRKYSNHMPAVVIHAMIKKKCGE